MSFPAFSPSRRPKRALRLMMIIGLAALLSGCSMRAIIGLDVNEDESGTFRMSMAFDEEMRQLLEQDADEPIDWTDPSAFEGDDSPASLLDEMPPGASVDPYTEDGFEGVTISYDFDSLTQLNAFLAEAETDGEEAFPFRVTTDGEGNFELITDGELFETADLSEEETEMVPPEMLASLFDFQLQIRLPGEVTSTNADATTDDGVLVWRMDPLADEPVTPAATSQVSGSGSTVLWVLLGVAAAVAVGGVVVMRRRDDGEPTGDEVEPAPEEEPVS